MSSDPAHGPHPGTAPRGVRALPVWQLPAAALTLVLGVDIVAVVATSWALLEHPPHPSDLATAALLCAVEVGYVEILRLVRPRVALLAKPRSSNLTSVTIFAGALVLSPGAGAVLAVVVALYERLRLGGSTPPPHRMVYSAATMVLACLAAWLVRSLWSTGGAVPHTGLGVVVLAMTAFTLVNNGLVGLAVGLTVPRPGLVALLGRAEDNLLELATLTLGALTATAIAITPWLAPLVLPAMVVMHRALLVPQLEEEARVDGKTGLLTVTAWHERAAADLARGGPPRGVLVIDLDHFKAVNDTFGHVAGDVVLAAVATALLGAVRSSDLVGRFGGEEFVVLVAPSDGGGAAEIEAVAHRIRGRVAALRVEVGRPAGSNATSACDAALEVVSGLRVSVGAGLQRPDGDPAGRGDLPELLQLADRALYAAKRAGRDRVRVAEMADPPGQTPRTD